MWNWISYKLPAESFGVVSEQDTEEDLTEVGAFAATGLFAQNVGRGDDDSVVTPLLLDISSGEEGMEWLVAGEITAAAKAAVAPPFCSRRSIDQGAACIPCFFGFNNNSNRNNYHHHNNNNHNHNHKKL